MGYVFIYFNLSRFINNLYRVKNGSSVPVYMYSYIVYQTISDVYRSRRVYAETFPILYTILEVDGWGLASSCVYTGILLILNFPTQMVQQVEWKTVTTFLEHHGSYS